MGYITLFGKDILCMGKMISLYRGWLQWVGAICFERYKEALCTAVLVSSEAEFTTEDSSIIVGEYPSYIQRINQYYYHYLNG